jgi:hypothetical protein
LRALGRVFAEEELAVVAAEEEGEAVQVVAECVQAVGGVADVGVPLTNVTPAANG